MTRPREKLRLVPQTVQLIDQLAEHSPILAADRQWWWSLVGALQRERLVTVLLGRERGVTSARIAWTQAGAEAACQAREASR
ncbi:hypothetical protein [Inquilinus limosus]|uniref:hypothetical protein n=1 Tax=Inquilinus limosus TaxID=171674 RepID=UPI000426B5BD|nr:hypothetical protein [Inquilinus limosus]